MMSDDSDDIVKFDTNGNVIGVLTHSDLAAPQGVAFDERGHLFSSSFSRNLVAEFDAEGHYVQTITEGNPQVPRSIAFDPTPATSVNASSWTRLKSRYR